LDILSIFEEWANFVQATRLCLEWEIASHQINEIETLFRQFVIQYERYSIKSVEFGSLIYYGSLLIFRDYIQHDSERLPAALISFHYLLHIADSIRNTGPAWATWQYPMERLCGMLLPLVRSQRHPYVNLQNQITVWTRFAHLKYRPGMNQRIRCPEETRVWPLHRVFNVQGITEELYSPYSMYTIDQTEERRLKEHYATARDLRLDGIGVSFDGILMEL
jgi:hypothetical protein